jgi:hypothetical protein
VSTATSLDRHDVRASGAVDVVDHRRQRRALAAAGRARDQHQAAFFARDCLEHSRQPEVLDGLDGHRNDAQDETDRAALLEHVDTETAEARHAVREVHLLGVLEFLPVDVRHDGGAHRDDVFVVEPFVLGNGHQEAPLPHHGIAAHLDVQVRRAVFDGDLQEIVDVHELRGWRSPLTSDP